MPFDPAEIERIAIDLRELEDRGMDRAEKSVASGLQALSDELIVASRRFVLSDDDFLELNRENFNQALTIIQSLDGALNAIADDAKESLLIEIRGITADLNRSLTAAGFNADQRLASVDREVVSAFLNFNLNRFNGGAAATSQVISDTIFQSLTTRVDEETLIRRLRSTVAGTVDRAGNPMARHARTWAMTAYNTFEGEVIQQATDRDAIGGWYYSGPLDGANRDFCARRAGRYFTDSEIRDDVAGNPIGAASMSNPGGWGCRHRLLPVSPEAFAEEQEAGNTGVRS